MNGKNLYVMAALSILVLASEPTLAQVNKTMQKPGTPASPSAPITRRMDMAQTDPEVTKLEAAAVKLEKQAKAKPKDSKLKVKAAEAYYQAGYACEYSKVLAPKPRYRGALKLYRKCLELNPDHAKAAAEKKQIEDIYRGMPGGIPK
jgi:tetratricopeptide (TPR) repeat protein